MEYRITTEYHGKPLRDFLRYRLRISAHLLARLKRDERGLLVNGERVTVRRILQEGDTVSVCDFPDEDGAPIEPVELKVTFGNMYTKEIEAFSDAVLNDYEPPVTGKNTILVQKIIEAVYTAGGGTLA